jgi:predicted  nucleic acid-binding Zn-ribbon protein
MAGPDDCAEINDEIEQIEIDLADIDDQLAHNPDPRWKATLEREKRALTRQLSALRRERRLLGCG